MTTPHRTLQMALDALDAITDDVDGTGLNTMPSFDKALDAITALREALAAPEPEPVALESVHLTRDTRGMCIVRVNGRVAIRDNGDIIDHMATLEWFAAPARVPLTDEGAAELLGFVRGVHFDAPGMDLSDFSAYNKERIRLVQIGWNAAHGIGGSK